MNDLRLRSVAFILLACLNNAPTWAGKPDILQIVADELGYGDLGCYQGRHRVPTESWIRWEAGVHRSASKLL